MTKKRTILVFGAGDHVGGPLAHYVLKSHPEVELRVATSNPSRVPQLQAKFDGAKAVHADYFDEQSLVDALEGVNGIFVITPDFFDEITAMSNLVSAVRQCSAVDHIVRIAADTPGMALHKLPRDLYKMGPGPAHQHFEAQAVLNASALPITHLNSLGYYMDDFLIHFSPPLKEKRLLVVPYDRKMCFTNTDELGEAAARILLEGPAKHAGEYYEFNSGQDPRTFREVAELIAKTTGEKIEYDPSPERFLAELGAVLEQVTGDGRAARYFIKNWEMERDHQDAFFGSSFGEAILGRKPKTLERWFEENREELL